MADVHAWVSLLKDILTAIAAGLAVWGINAWRRDFLGKRKIELAEDTLNLFYQARDAVKAIRSPMAFGSESEDIKPVEGELPETLHWRKTVAPMYKRFDARSELFSQLQATRYRFMARFGEETARPFDELRLLINECFIAARMLVSTAADLAVADDSPDMREATRRLRDSRRKWEATMWDMGEKDEINTRLNTTVQSMEEVCRSIIDHKGLGQRFKAWWTAPVGRHASSEK